MRPARMLINFYDDFVARDLLHEEGKSMALLVVFDSRWLKPMHNQLNWGPWGLHFSFIHASSLHDGDLQDDSNLLRQKLAG